MVKWDNQTQETVHSTGAKSKYELQVSFCSDRPVMHPSLGLRHRGWCMVKHGQTIQPTRAPPLPCIPSVFQAAPVPAAAKAPTPTASATASAKSTSPPAVALAAGTWDLSTGDAPATPALPWPAAATEPVAQEATVKAAVALPPAAATAPAMSPSSHAKPGELITAANVAPGLRVVRGPDWQWGVQDGFAGSRGTLMKEAARSGWWIVQWDGVGSQNSYRVGYEGKHDLQVRNPLSLVQAACCAALRLMAAPPACQGAWEPAETEDQHPTFMMSPALPGCRLPLCSSPPLMTRWQRHPQLLLPSQPPLPQSLMQPQAHSLSQKRSSQQPTQPQGSGWFEAQTGSGASRTGVQGAWAPC